MPYCNTICRGYGAFPSLLYYRHGDFRQASKCLGQLTEVAGCADRTKPNELKVAFIGRRVILQYTDNYQSVKKSS